MCCGENNQNLIAEYKLHLYFPLQLLSVSVDLSVSVVTSAGEERLGVTHVYAWDMMGLQNHANAQTSQSADVLGRAASAAPVASAPLEHAPAYCEKSILNPEHSQFAS